MTQYTEDEVIEILKEHPKLIRRIIENYIQSEEFINRLQEASTSSLFWKK